MAGSNMVLFDSGYSQRPTMYGKSIVRKWYDKIIGHTPNYMRGFSREVMAHHTTNTGHAFRRATESLGAGAIFGFIHAEVKGGLDGFGVPLDLTSGLAGIAASVFLAHHDISQEASNFGASGLTVYGFRKMYDVIAEKKLAAGKTPGGTFGPAQHAKIAGEFGSESNDPIIAAARNL